MRQFEVGDIITQDPRRPSATGLTPVVVVPRLWVVRAVNLEEKEQAKKYTMASSPLFTTEYWSYAAHITGYPGCWYMNPQCCLLASPVERLLYAYVQGRGSCHVANR